MSNHTLLTPLPSWKRYVTFERPQIVYLKLINELFYLIHKVKPTFIAVSSRMFPKKIGSRELSDLIKSPSLGNDSCASTI